ncbi:hypothetical protein D3C71_1840840 [compost metagenome]
MRFGTQQCQVRKRWQAGGAAFAQCLFGKGEIALFGQLHQQGMIGQVRLDDHLARFFSPARTACHLDDQLGHALTGAEVAGEQAAVGVENRYQCHPGKVMALGEHLRADEDAWLAALNGRKQLSHCILA